MQQPLTIGSNSTENVQMSERETSAVSSTREMRLLAAV
jgi:hypothetical protein